MTRRLFSHLLALVTLLAPVAASAAPVVARPIVARPIMVRVVVVTAFEIGADSGDAPGEFQAWANVLPQRLPFPAGVRNLRYDPASHVLAVSTGEGTGHAAASIMALGMDPRFDLRRAYWLVAAIAGVNPDAASIGSAAWIGDIVDTDFGYEIDPREVPADWSTGYIPWDRTTPYEQPAPRDTSDNLFPLNKGLRDWAFALTRGVSLPDRPALQAARAPYTAFPEALKPPHVLVGAEATGQSFWLGALMNRHAEAWTRYWAGGPEPFVMSAMEDSGIARSIAMLGKLGRVSPDRLMVLRTASDFTVPPPGMSAPALLADEMHKYPAMQASLDAAFLVGSPVVHEIAGHWARYAAHVPGER